MRRILAVAAATTSLLLAGAAPASANLCYIEKEGLPRITYPCPGYNDQPVPVPTAVVFSIGGPGYHTPPYSFVKLKRGGTIYFVNNSTIPARYRGNGFDSGIVMGGAFTTVDGVSSLPVGDYTVIDIDGWVAGVLYIEP